MLPVPFTRTVKTRWDGQHLKGLYDSDSSSDSSSSGSDSSDYYSSNDGSGTGTGTATTYTPRTGVASTRTGSSSRSATSSQRTPRPGLTPRSQATGLTRGPSLGTSLSRAPPEDDEDEELDISQLDEEDRIALQEQEYFRKRTPFEQLQDFRKRAAEKRRHQGLIHHEERIREREERKQKEAARERAIRLGKKRRSLKKRVMRDRTLEFLDKVKAEDARRHEENSFRRLEDMKASKLLFDLRYNWGQEHDARKAAEAKKKAEDDYQAALKAAEDGRQATRARISAEDEKARVSGELMTQEVLKIMRKAGVIAGVNDPLPDPLPRQRETATSVVLITKIHAERVNVLHSIAPEPEGGHPNPNASGKPPRPPAGDAQKEQKKQAEEAAAAMAAAEPQATDGGGVKGNRERAESGASAATGGSRGRRRRVGLGGKKQKKKKELTYFTVDLRRFRNVEEMKGEKIGERGAIHLAKDLIKGACPRLTSLNLTWNDIKRRGGDTLLNCFTRGCATRLRFLDLSFNNLPPQTADALVATLEAGGLPELEVLNLKGNALGDRGAMTLTRAVFQNLMPELRKLFLQKNQINSAGVVALFRAFGNLGSSMSKIEHVDLRQNNLSAAWAREMDPRPAFFQA